MFATVLPPDDADLPVDHCVLLLGVTWATYEALLASRGESAVPRLTYCEGALELMSPSSQHERLKKMIARLLEHYSFVRDVPLAGLGSTTYRDASKKLGLEPDECYFAGAEREGVPDIAIEVVWTSGRVDKLRVYAGLGIPEVWVWRRGRLQVHRLRDSAYVIVPRSEFLPDLDLDLLTSFATHPDQMEAVRLWHKTLVATAGR
jgi:Uma2 family endonuclease